MRARALAATALAVAAAAAWPAAASAHGLVGRADLPIPTWLFAYAACIVLVASFAALSVLWKEPRFDSVRERRLFRVPRWVDPLCGAIGVAIFVLIVYSGVAGNQEQAQNFAPNVVYVHFWVGLVIVSVLLGDVFRAFNPWRAVGRAIGWIAARAGIRSPVRRPYPDRLGRWPTVATLLGFGWLELVYPETPQTLGWLCLGFALFQLAAMAVYGVERWGENGDGFGVYYNVFARLAPLHRRDGVLYLRPPLTGAPGLPEVAGSVALLCTAIGITTFDGFSNGSVWASLGPDLTDVFHDIGFGVTAAGEAADTVGLMVAVGLVTTFYHLGIRGMESVGGGHTRRELALKFAHSLAPIAWAYAVAHYFSLLVFNGQTIAYLISDPLGNGSDVFGTADKTIDYGVISGRTIWYVQVAALVLGHVCGLILAHERALKLYTRVRTATRSQYWMLVVMVGFTSLGLWLLSAVRQ
ncbi:MAG: fenitrothion hydrolase [Thermoleophilaceae bacterium]